MKKLLELEEIKELFTEVQKSSIFSDQKQMADAIPKLAVEEILEKYNQEKNKVNFDLKNFVTTHFSFPESLNMILLNIVKTYKNTSKNFGNIYLYLIRKTKAL